MIMSTSQIKMTGDNNGALIDLIMSALLLMQNSRKRSLFLLRRVKARDQRTHAPKLIRAFSIRIYFKIFIYYCISRQIRHRSDYADAHSDLRILCPFMALRLLFPLRKHAYSNILKILPSKK